jgi:signal transduction histidine kinase
MAASATLSKHNEVLPLSVATVAEVAFAFLAVQQMAQADRDIFGRLLVAFGDGEGQLRAANAAAGAAIDWLSISGALNLLGFMVSGAAITFVVLKLPGVPRVLATTSIFVLTLLYQWSCWHLFHAEAHPVGFFVSLAAGFAGGLILRAREDRRRELEAHYYELKIKNQELLDTRLTLLKQDEIERRVLAADLHDQVLNDLKQVAQRFERYTQDHDEQNAQAIRDLTNQVMREIREVMDSLSPSVLEHLGLAAAVEDCLRRGSERAGFKVRFKNRIDMSELECLSMVEQGLLYRLVQESITNICKHAGASTVRATIEREGEEILLIRISDDGKGIDPALMRADSRGLKYMRYRADLIGATIGWKPGDNGKGTTVEIRLSLSERGAPTGQEAPAAPAEQQTL